MSYRWSISCIQKLWPVVIALGWGLASCNQRPIGSIDGELAQEASSDLPNVVATNRVLCDLAEQIAADTIDLTCLLESGQDPHTYQARPSDRQALDEADLVLYGGYQFAPAISELVAASRSQAPKVPVFEVAVPQPLTGEAHYHDEVDTSEHGAEDDHSHETETSSVHDDDEQVADPHVWQNATNAAAIATTIAENLTAINPDEAPLYQDNAALISEQFAALDDWVRSQVNTIPVGNRVLVTTHDSFQYFAAAYGLEAMAALSGLSTEEQPSARALKGIVDEVKDTGVPTIFAESPSSTQLIDTVANNAGVDVGDRPLLVAGPDELDSEADTLQAMLVVNTCTIVNGLGGTCVEASAPRVPSTP